MAKSGRCEANRSHRAEAFRTTRRSSSSITAVSRPLSGGDCFVGHAAGSRQVRLNEIDEGAHLGRRQVPGRVERVEREAVAVPVRKKLDQGPLPYEVLHADRLHPGDPHACQAGAEHRAELGHHEAACRPHLNDLVALPKPPFLDRLARQGIPDLDAGVIDEVGRRFRPIVRLHIGRRRNRDRARLDEFPGDQRGLRRRPEPHGDVEPLAHQIAQLISGDQLERQVGIQRQELRDVRGEHQA